MPIDTPLTGLLGIRHPILLAPMDVVVGAVQRTLPDQRSRASLGRP